MKIKYNDLIQVYNDFFNQLVIFLVFRYTMRKNFKEYLDINPLNDVIRLMSLKSNLDMNLDNKLNYMVILIYVRILTINRTGLNKSYNMISKSSKKIKLNKHSEN